MRLHCPAPLTHPVHLSLFQVKPGIDRSQSDSRSNGEDPLSTHPGQYHIPFHKPIITFITYNLTLIPLTPHP